MELNLNRISKKSTYTVGKLSINGTYFCDTMEDADRGLNQFTPISIIQKTKVQSQTAIPTGLYQITLDQVSPRLSKKEMYKSISGKLPRLLNVPGFDGILIHVGNTDKDSSGCILVGFNKVKGQVINSKDTFFKLYTKLKEASDKGEQITIKIQ